MERIKATLNECRDDALKKRAHLAAEAALRAGGILNNKYGTSLAVCSKGEIDLVTDADTASEKAIVAILGEGDGKSHILAEESRSFRNFLPTDPVWIIDPLDGTTNFAHGFPWFAVSIAFAHDNRTEIGVIYAPRQDEFFCAIRGAGAWLNGVRIAVSSVGDLNGSLLATGFPYDVRRNPEPVLGALGALITKCQGIRRAGAAALDLAYVACGRLDGFWEVKLKPWDTAAGQLLVEEAGGLVTDFRRRVHSLDSPEIAASNGQIHEELTGFLARYSISEPEDHACRNSS